MTTDSERESVVVTWDDVLQALDALAEDLQVLMNEMQGLFERVDAVEHRAGKLFGRGDGSSIPDHDGSSTSVVGASEGRPSAGSSSGDSAEGGQADE